MEGKETLKSAEADRNKSDQSGQEQLEVGAGKMESTLIILVVLVIAVLGRANAVAVAAAVLLLLKLLQIDNIVFPILEKDGVNAGLVLLVAAILVPLANGNINYQNLMRVFTSWVGVTAFFFSLLTTYLSGQGLQYLTVQGHAELMPALIFGAVIAAAFLGGLPVGPFVTSGLLAVFVKFMSKI